MNKKEIYSIFFTILFLLISCETKPTESSNNNPTIQNIAADPDTILVNGTSIITCFAIDEDDDSLSYKWESEYGEISGADNQIQWTAPDSIGIYNIKCQVDDNNDGTVTGSLKIVVTNETIIDPTNNFLNVPADYPTIQEAITASIDGDTILVEPGTYYENVNFNGKNITLASKFILFDDKEFIIDTVIDGGRKTSVVTFENGENEDTKLIGFTIQNGNTDNDLIRRGGGIFCKNSKPTLEHLIIQNNYAAVGGGVEMEDSNSIIRNCTISNNEAHYEGAGIGVTNSSIEIHNSIIAHNLIDRDAPNYPTFDGIAGAGISARLSDIKLSNTSIHNNLLNQFQGVGAGIRLFESNIVFDEYYRCNIYNNKVTPYLGNAGQDMYFSPGWGKDIPTTKVYLDTFTVMTPTGYYAYPIENYTFDIKNSTTDQPELLSDYFISPNGNDSNSGASPENPVKTISYILKNLVRGESDSITIHLANGIYSPSANGESYSMRLQSNTSIIGESTDGVILDAENTAGVILLQDITNCTLTNLSIRNGNVFEGFGGGIGAYNSSYNGKNLNISNCISLDAYQSLGGGIGLYNSIAILDSIIIADNDGGGISAYSNSSLLLSNSQIKRNSTDHEGGGISIFGNCQANISNSKIQYNDAHYGGGIFNGGILNLENAIIANNDSESEAGGGINNVGDLIINNSVIVNNEVKNSFSPEVNGGNLFSDGSTIKISNSIVWDGKPANIFINDVDEGNTEISISYSNIQNGENGIEALTNYTINWLEGNIDTDPLFIDPDSGDFHLQSVSPCIDAGNPGSQYDDSDGSRNDMGAYGGPGGDW